MSRATIDTSTPSGRALPMGVPSDADTNYWTAVRGYAAGGALFRGGAEWAAWPVVTEAARQLALIEYAANHDLPVVM
jgi:hypothetical protein